MIRRLDDHIVHPRTFYASMSAADPIRQKLGLEKLTFQIFRRTYATLAYGEHMGTLKDVQKQLRHSRPDITLENYVKDIPESVYSIHHSKP